MCQMCEEADAYMAQLEAASKKAAKEQKPAGTGVRLAGDARPADERTQAEARGRQ